VIYQNFRFIDVAAILLGLSNLSNLYNYLAKNSCGQFTSNNSPSLSNIHARMSSPLPPRATSSLTLPGHLLALPALPSLGDCFPCGSVDLSKYFLYSSTLSLLVNHFAILFAQNKIIWPRRNQKPRRRLLLTVV
jgi:hypothetical protein